LKLLKSGFATTFVDHSAAMVEQVREKLEGNPRAKKATLLAADIVQMAAIPSEHFELSLAMGDPLSICSDPAGAAREMRRITRKGGIVIATADNKLAALDYYVEQGNLDELEKFVRTGRTHWLTADLREQFELTTFTPDSLRKLFEKSGFEVIDLRGKPIIPARQNKRILADPNGIPRLLRLEQELARDPASAGRSGHLQIVARRV
jgi:ubiquinone/menaquinone biosynthesis C-methylase UbiE